MSEHDMVLESDQRWAINLDWLRENNRSFTTMTKGALCPKCRKKLKVDLVEAKTGDILKAAKGCCSKEEDFITASMPLHESLFRVFLANGNQPLSTDELVKELNARRGIEAYRTPVTTLLRMLRSDQHYGVQKTE